MADLFWLGAIGGLGTLDLWLSRNHPEWTLSHRSRRWFRTEHPIGRTAFTIGLLYGSNVLHRHIVDWLPDAPS